jgi:hypothetical protein
LGIGFLKAHALDAFWILIGLAIPIPPRERVDSLNVDGSEADRALLDEAAQNLRDRVVNATRKGK